MDTLMFRQRIQERMQQGERLTDDEIAFITKGSEDLAGTAPGIFILMSHPIRRSNNCQVNFPIKRSGHRELNRSSRNRPTRSI